MINQIKHLFPSADPLVDFELRDNSDGKGPFIARWDTAKLGQQPTPEQLAAVAAAANSAYIKATSIKKIDADVDAIYDKAIGNRATEYSEAESQAVAFKTAGYTGKVPAYVENWLSNNTKAFTTATQAADDIIAQATAWRGAATAIRSSRLLAKKNLMNDVPTAMAQWDGFVAVIRGQLGL